VGGWPAFWVAAVALFAWAVYADVRLGSEDRLARWWLARVEAWGPATGPLSFVLSAAALGGFGLLAYAGHAVAEHLGNPLWALVATGPAMLVYVPFSFATAPAQYRGYLDWRFALAHAGADARLQRTIAWCAGPPSLLGIGAVTLALASAFVPSF
jgi:hypothetical protein